MTSCVSIRQPVKQRLNFTAPKPQLLPQLRLRLVGWSLQPQDQIAICEPRQGQPKRLPALAFDRIAQACSTRQALGNNKTQPCLLLSPGFEEQQIEAIAAEGLARRNDSRKLLWLVQTVLPVETGRDFRRRDDDDPWHDAHESRHDRPEYACAREIRGYACGALPMADRCVSWTTPLNQEKPRITTGHGLFVKKGWFRAVDNFRPTR